MAEKGVDISGQESTVVTDAMLQWADVVVTVCGHADEQCPVLPEHVSKVHWPLTDPAKATGSDEEIMREFRATRDEIEQRVRVVGRDDPRGRIESTKLGCILADLVGVGYYDPGQLQLPVAEHRPNSRTADIAGSPDNYTKWLHIPCRS